MNFLIFYKKNIFFTNIYFYENNYWCNHVIKFLKIFLILISLFRIAGSSSYLLVRLQHIPVSLVTVFSSEIFNGFIQRVLNIVGSVLVTLSFCCLSLVLLSVWISQYPDLNISLATQSAEGQIWRRCLDFNNIEVAQNYTFNKYYLLRSYLSN